MRFTGMFFTLVVTLIAVGARADDQVPAKAEPESYVKLKIEVEIRGVLTVNKDEFVLVVGGEQNEKKQGWVLDFGDEKVLREGARLHHNKVVTVKGSAVLRGVGSETRQVLGGFPERPVKMAATKSVFDIERKVSVKTVEAAPKP